MLRTSIATAILAAAFIFPAETLRAQSELTTAEVSTPEALVATLYDTFQRRPGEHIDWDRFSRFFLPGALMIPNVEQTGGEFRVMGVQDFSRWIDGIFAENSPIGSESDHGLKEEEIHSIIEEYGDIALVMSTYERRPWDSMEVDGRGINGITLVRNGGRWWIASIVWDEESGGGPIPGRYRP